MDGLLTVLQSDSRLFSTEGVFLRNLALELAVKGDTDLLRGLLADETTRARFFTDVDGVMVFDSQRFGWVVSNREFLPDSYTRFRNAIGLVDGHGRGIVGSRDVELVWPFKDCWLEGGQSKSEEGREEVFYNETLAPAQVDRLLSPKVLTGAKRFTKDGAKPAVGLADGDSLVIKGNNLLGIASLLARFENQVRVIYIDPPYNPSNSNNTFCYNNRFNHSTWLTFMANRLRIAKRLLRPDGALIVAIDDNEHSYLGVLLNEMFPDHDVESIAIVHNPRGVQGTNFSYTHESAYFVLPKNMRTVADKENGEVAWTQLGRRVAS
jgi:adenine-specific DNA-methyltransferase